MKQQSDEIAATDRNDPPINELLHRHHVPLVWETIMCNLSGEDMANCLRVSKGLRSVILDCMDRNVKFRHQMHAAATCSATKKSRASRSVSQIQICGSIGALRAVDSILLSGGRTVLKTNRNGKTLEIPIAKSAEGSRPWMLLNVHPTLDKDSMYLEEECGCTLLDLSKSDVKTIPQPVQADRREWNFFGSEPRCLRYRLFSERKVCGEKQSVIMSLLDNSGKIRSEVLLGTIGGNATLRHAASNEEVYR